MLARFVFPTLLLLATPVLAQTPEPNAAPGNENGRYQMTPAPNGFLRLDTRTGTVSLCTVAGSSAECRAAADERMALMNEIERLSRRNAELERRPPSTPPRPSAGLPSREDMGKAMDYAEEFMRRMMRIMRDETRGPT